MLPPHPTEHKKCSQRIKIATLIIAFVLFAAPGSAHGQWIVTDPGLFSWETINDIAKKTGALLREHSALLWKQTQLMFGTRLAHDAAIALSSGNTGQTLRNP